MGKLIRNGNAFTEGYLLETDGFSFRPIPGLNKSTGGFNNAGFHDQELYAFGVD